jgi:hypothetical protein
MPPAAAQQADGLQQPPPDGLGKLSCLDANTLGEMLRVAFKEGVLARLATTSRQLCTSARSGVPLTLYVDEPGDAQLLVQSHAHGRPPFSGCEHLHLEACTTADCLMAVGVLGAAQHWSALQRMHLELSVDEEELPGGHTAEFCVVPVLSTLLALQQLRSLQLTIPDLGPCSAACVGSLVQLTRLYLDSHNTASSTEAAAAAAAGDRLDLRPWSRLTNLRELRMGGVAVVQPAAGSSFLPSSLTALTLDSTYQAQAAWLACWLTHLPGCPQLQDFSVIYPLVQNLQQHPSAHPAAVIHLLTRHTPRLRNLTAAFHASHVQANWGLAVAGLPDAAAPVEGEWRPDAALEALTGLERIDGGHSLTVKALSDWQHLAQLAALTELCRIHFHHAPQLQAGTLLVALRLRGCHVHLDGHGLGRLLLACPQLHTAEVTIATPLVSTPVDPSGEQLQPHPMLQVMDLGRCYFWEPEATEAEAAAAAAAAPAAVAAAATAATATAAAASQFGALAPVLAGVSELALRGWPASSSSSSSHASSTLPDLSACTALRVLRFGCHEGGPDHAHPEQEEFLSMVSPLVTLQQLLLIDAPRLNARAALVAQSMLPQLQRITLRRCGKQLPLLPEGSGWQREGQALTRVKQLLRPGLVLGLERW